MANLITFDLGSTGPGSYLIQQMYEQYLANPPSGYDVFAHYNIHDLCDQVSKPGNMLQVAEVIAHGNPYYLGQILITNVQTLATALASASPSARFLFSGCNTGTWSPQQQQQQPNTFCISAYLASMAPCQVFGTKGYVDTGTWALQNITCSQNDWGQSTDIYLNSTNSKAPGIVFEQKPRTSMPKYMIPNWTPNPIPISSLPTSLQAWLGELLPRTVQGPSQKIKINQRTAANVRISLNSDVFGFYGTGGNTVMQESTVNTYRITMTFAQQQQLMALWNPLVAGVAVVAQPAVPTSVKP